MRLGEDHPPSGHPIDWGGMPTMMRGQISADVIAVAVIAVAIGLVIWLGFLPGMVARSRGHPSADAIRLCGLFGILFWPLWIIAAIWAYTGPRRSRLPLISTTRLTFDPMVPIPPPPPVDDDGPGLFAIEGVDRANGMDTRIAIRAESPANAKVKAELKGIIVTRVLRRE